MMCADETDDDAEEHPKEKWYNHKPSGLGKAIAGFILYGLFIFVDAKEVWPISHIIASLAGVAATIALLYLEVLAPGVINFRWFLRYSAIIFAVGILIYAVAPPNIPEETEVSGWLQAGNEPTPPNGCDKYKASGRGPPDDALKILIGDNVLWRRGMGKITAMTVGTCKSLSMERDALGISIDADLYDANGKLIARVVKGQIRALTGENVQLRRNGDLTTMIVSDGRGAELLYLRYLNPTTLQGRVLSCNRCPATVECIS
jgi:hypothetical protein